MSEFMTSLVLVAYGTAAIVGVQLLANGLVHLSSLVARRNGPLTRTGPVPQALVGELVLLVGGLFLLLQGVVVVLWTFS